MITKIANNIKDQKIYTPVEQDSSIPKELAKMVSATGAGVLGARAAHAAYDYAPVIKGYNEHNKLKNNLQGHVRDQSKKYVGLLKEMKSARRNPANKTLLETLGNPLLKLEFANKVRNERLVGKEQLSKIMNKVTRDKSKFHSLAARQNRAGSGVLGGYTALGLYGLSRYLKGKNNHEDT